MGHVLDFSCEGLARETMLDRELDTPTATYYLQATYTDAGSCLVVGKQPRYRDISLGH